jgi:membrane protein YqaA with SNARE-associated domain
MQLWLLLTGVFVVQESFSTTFVVLEAVRAHYPILLIHLLWIAVVIAEVYVGYSLGKWIQKRFTGSRFEKWVGMWIQQANDLIGKNGEKVALIFVTILTAPFFTGFVASWLPISFWTILIFSILGDLVWYVTVWLGVYGANEFASSLQTTVISIAILTIVLSIPVAMWRRKMLQRKPEL